MTSFTKAARLAVVSLGLAALFVGCGGPDNESSALTNTDGTKTQVINSGGGGMSPEEYTKKAAGSAGKNLMEEKGYPGAKKK